MEIATNHSQSVQSSVQTLVSGGMLYPGRCGVWQPVVANASIPVAAAPVAMTELLKESIIANTDFTTTSLIAKRRLSSKKRRLQHQNGSTGSDISTDQSPVSSATGSPAVPSAACTQSDKMDMDPFEASSSVVRTTMAGGRPQETSQSSLTSSSSGVPFGRAGGAQYITMAPTTHPVGLLHNQIANPMLSQLQQGLNYRFLQEQSLLQQQAVGVSSSRIEHPQPITDRTQRVSTRGNMPSEGGSGFKWCIAHVVIAQQIHRHKQQQSEAFRIHPNLPTFSTSFQSPPNLPHSHTPPGPSSSFSLVAQQQPQHPQQPPPHQQLPSQPPTMVTSAPHMPHLALMQYSLPQTNTTAANFPGYLAVPYSSLQDLQLRMNPHQSLLPHIQLAGSGAIPVVKPVMTMADSMVGLNPCMQVMATATGIPLQQQQQQQLAQLAMAHSNPTMMQGPSTVAGSWVAPVPVMNSCIINHDTMPAPWVK